MPFVVINGLLPKHARQVPALTVAIKTITADLLEGVEPKQVHLRPRYEMIPNPEEPVFFDFRIETSYFADEDDRPEEQYQLKLAIARMIRMAFKNRYPTEGFMVYLDRGPLVKLDAIPVTRES